MKKETFLSLLIFLSFAFISSAGEAGPVLMPSLNPDNPKAVVERITANYVPWTKAEFSGKIKSKKLPVNPTIKLYMERDSMIQLSVRAMLLGEIGRITVTNSRIQAVNKMKRIYVDESTENILEIYPDLISDLQSLLLARVVILGQGELKPGDYNNVEIESDTQGGYLLIPNLEENKLKFNYGYLIAGNGRTQALVANLPSNLGLELIYNYVNNGLQIGMTIDTKGKQEKADIEFSSVKWGGSPLSDVNVMNYRRVSVKEFLKSFK